MATTITPSDFTANITDNITLNTRDFGSSSTYVRTECTEADQRIVKVALKAGAEEVQTWTTLFNYGTANAAGTGITTEFQYVRLTNLDDTNYCIVQFVMQTSHNRFNIKLGPYESFMLQDNAAVALCVEGPEVGYTAFSTIKTIQAAADTAACDVEIVTVFKPAL